MPELPEVETTKNGIEPHIIHQTFKKVIVRQAQLRWKVPNNLDNLLKSHEVLAIERRAKYILIYTGHFSVKPPACGVHGIFPLSRHSTNLINAGDKLQQGEKHKARSSCHVDHQRGCLLIHLGMSGSLKILPPQHISSAQKHDHVDFIFNNDYIMRYTDPRRFGAVLWIELPNPLEHKLLAHLGPEPLGNNFSSKYLLEKIKTKSSSIKQTIMDNKIVVGVGNIYANEALFLSHIRPNRPANSLTINEIKSLVKNIKLVLRQAIEQGGTTLKDFKNPANKPGYFKQQLLVYGKKNQPCSRCNDAKHLLIEIRQNNRSSVFCMNCQY